MFLAPNNNTQKDNIKKINKEYIPQQIRLNKELKNIFTDDFKTIQLIYDTTPKTFTKGPQGPNAPYGAGKNITYFTYEYNFM